MSSAMYHDHGSTSAANFIFEFESVPRSELSNSLVPGQILQ